MIGIVAMADGLRVADEKVAALVCALVELVDDGLRCRLFEIDHDIAAENHVIHTRRKGVHEVKLTECDRLTDAVLHKVIAIRLLYHVVLDPLGWHT